MQEAAATRRAVGAGIVLVLLSPWPAPEALALRGRAALGWYLPGRPAVPPPYRSVHPRPRRDPEGWTVTGQARTAWRGSGESRGAPEVRADAFVPERDLGGLRSTWTLGTAPDLGEARLRWEGGDVGTAPRDPDVPARGTLRGTVEAGAASAEGEAIVEVVADADGYRMRTVLPGRWTLELGDQTLKLVLDFDVRLDPPALSR